MGRRSISVVNVPVAGGAAGGICKLRSPQIRSFSHTLGKDDDTGDNKAADDQLAWIHNVGLLLNILKKPAREFLYLLTLEPLTTMKEKITCLLIDDDLDDQEIFKLALQDVNDTVHFLTANDGAAGLQLLNTAENLTPHYIFLDLNMPRMGGKDCLTAIRNIPHLSEIPVIIYSTSSDPRDIRETKSLGASDYIVKQFDINSLKDILSRYF
jgi:CheY-like chemotaxis protein